MDALKTLFETDFHGKTLFKNQLDLVNNLLSNEQSPFYHNANDEEFARAQSRLKAYISQLLSSNVTRTVTPDFIKGLSILISDKNIPELNVDELISLLIKDLKTKNAPALKANQSKTILDDFYSDYDSSNYVAIIVSDPLEIEGRVNQAGFSLGSALFRDFLESIRDIKRDFKNYRINFPMDSSARNFWKGFYKRLHDYISPNIETIDFKVLHSKFALSATLLARIENDLSFAQSNVEEICKDIITTLNDGGRIMVFLNQAPIYSVPLIAFNPAGPIIKLYGFLNNIKTENRLYQFQNEEITLWRFFVWEKMKSTHQGTNLKFTDLL